MTLQLPARSFDLDLPARSVQSYTHDSLELTINGNDFMILPSFSGLDSFYFDFDVYTTSEFGSMIINLQNDDETKRWDITFYTGNGLAFRENGVVKFIGTYPFATYMNVIYRYDGSKIYLDIDGVNAGSHTPVNSMSDFTRHILFGLYSGGAYSGQTYSANQKVKNFKGSIRFGTAYTDIAQTTEANVNDTIASIENKGFAGGNIIQSTAGARPTLSAATSITIYSIPLTLPARDGYGTYTAPGDGEGAVFDEDVFDGSVFG